uniref:RRM domain-containing protein n=1 Tax=Heligmosomoides polygyrus TaxID=6339 RepID=A0A183GBS5_HELPZ
LGCFNLSVYTTEADLRDLFGEFVCIFLYIFYDHPTGRSRGFGFVYFDRLEDACAARDKLSGKEIDGHKIRVDYSLTKRAHTPTPGQYMGAIRGSRRNYGGYSSVPRTERVREASYQCVSFRSERRESYRDGYSARGSRY